ncbi:MAG TPA: hypothetical protein VF797_12795 [Noviherbaspirillum sp.]
MSSENKKQPADAGSAGSGVTIGSAASGSASGNQALSESNLDAITGGAGEVLNLNVDDDTDLSVLGTDEYTLAGITSKSNAKPGDGTN